MRAWTDTDVHEPRRRGLPRTTALAYWDRHIAGNLAYQLELDPGTDSLPAARADELTRWADAVLAAPWPRLHRW